MNGRPAPILHDESSTVDTVGRLLGFTPLVADHGGPRVRFTDATTSHAAADSNNTASSRAHVLRVLTNFGPLADHELVAMHDLMVTRARDNLRDFTLTPAFTPQRLRTARAELTEDGLVVFTGIYRLTPSKRRAQVWSVA